MKRYIIAPLIVIVVGILSASSIITSLNGSHDIDAKTKAEVYKVLDDFIASFNARDAKAHFATYHFPHYRLASGKMTILESSTSADTTNFLHRLVQSGWHHTVWDHRNIVQASKDKVHVDTQFTRYRADGSKIASYESLYVLTYEQGRWGIKLRSSFAE